MAGQDGKDRWNVETDETKFLRQFRPQWWVWVHTQSICRHTPWLLLAVCRCVHTTAVYYNKIWAWSRQMGRTMPVSQCCRADLKRKIFWCLLGEATPMEVTLSLLTGATMQSGTLQLTSVAKLQCGNVHAAAIHHNVPSAVVDGDTRGGNLPPPICKPVSDL